jgi:hypothetical protein
MMIVLGKSEHVYQNVLMSMKVQQLAVLRTGCESESGCDCGLSLSQSESGRYQSPNSSDPNPTSGPHPHLQNTSPPGNEQPNDDRM